MIKTKLGTEVPAHIVGIVYFCRYTPKTETKPATIKVIGEFLSSKHGEALEVYANTRNPESQMVTGKDSKTLTTNLLRLHERLENPKWVDDLGEYL
jgi:hypothetical protein